jgi:nitrile hydratase beta subunit
MNGIHDLGGMHGLGPVEREVNEPVFHADWERRVFGMFLPIFALGAFNIDELRHAIERMGAPAYLNTSYYEHWLFAYETLLVEKGVLTAAELAARRQQIAGEGS